MGNSYDKIGLPAEVIASSFGKIKDKTPDEIKELKKEDISLSLLNMIIFNTLTISSLVAKIEKIDKVVVIGHHLRILELEQLFEMGYQFLSKGTSKIMFLKYSSFLGSLGLLIDHANLDNIKA
jgi:pantothenate kinase